MVKSYLYACPKSSRLLPRFCFGVPEFVADNCAQHTQPLGALHQLRRRRLCRLQRNLDQRTRRQRPGPGHRRRPRSRPRERRGPHMGHQKGRADLALARPQVQSGGVGHLAESDGPRHLRGWIHGRIAAAMGYEDVDGGNDVQRAQERRVCAGVGPVRYKAGEWCKRCPYHCLGSDCRGRAV